MKLWISSILAVTIAIISALFIPMTDIAISFINEISQLAINLGRYIAFPLVFFSLAVSVCKLRREKLLIRTIAHTALFITGSTILLVVTGVIIALIFSPERIPLIVESQSRFDLSEQSNTLFSIFPQNMFTVLTGNSNILLPLYFLSFAFGVVMYRDREISEPSFNLFDSMSRLLFDLNRYIVYISPLLLAVLAFSSTAALKSISDTSMFSDLILMLVISTSIILFGVYPLILFLTDRKSNPYKVLLSLMIPLLSGLFSGDSFFTLSSLTYTGKKELRCSRKNGAVTLPLSAMFAKAGTAMVTAISFITILRSYSSLEITLYQIVWVILMSFLFSFSLASIPAAGAYTAIYMLSTLYSQSHSGHTDSYLLIKPVAPLLIGLAVILDVATSSLIMILIGRKVVKK